MVLALILLLVLVLRFYYSGTAGAWAGSNFTSATGATSVVGTNGATFYITGVQLEVGSTATSFDYRPYGTELLTYKLLITNALCQFNLHMPNTDYANFKKKSLLTKPNFKMRMGKQ
jgi:hypothetical protein